jgi:hypothetical protein
MPHIITSGTILFVKVCAIFHDLIFDVIPLITLQSVHPTSKISLRTLNLSEREIRFCFSTSRKLIKFPKRRFQILQFGKSLFRPYIRTISFVNIMPLSYNEYAAKTVL